MISRRFFLAIYKWSLSKNLKSIYDSLVGLDDALISKDGINIKTPIS